MAELGWEPSIDAAHIGVAANAGVVALTGHVQSYPQKVAAEQGGGSGERREGRGRGIEVKLPYDVIRGDERIAAAAIERLAWDSSVLPPDAVEIRVDKRMDHAERRSRLVLPEGSRRAGRPNSDRRRRRFQSDRDQADGERGRYRPKRHARSASPLVLRSEHDQGQRSGRQDQVDRAGHDLECARPWRAPPRGRRRERQTSKT